MANGSTKPGYAKADRFRDRRAHVHEDAAEALRRFRDSIDLEEQVETPRFVVNVAAPSRSRRSLSDSLRPLVRKVRSSAKLAILVCGAVAGVVAGVILGVVRALHAIGVVK